MAGRATLLSSDLSSGLAAAVRTARQVDLSDSLDAIRTDVGERVEVGRELVGDAAESLGVAVARMQGRSQRRSRRPALIALTIGIIGVIVLAVWWRRRQAMDAVVDVEALDRELLDRAADDGMGSAIGSPTTPEQASGSASQ
jgi:hypothetical protein